MSGGHGGRRKKHEEHEEHENHERWLVTYADMLTLLMVLFIVMFAMSSVDQQKYNALKNGLAEGFGATSSFMKGSDSILDGHLNEATDPSLKGTQIFEQLSPEQQTLVTKALDQEKARAQQASYDAASKEATKLKDAQQALMGALSKAGLADDVSTTIDDRGLVVSLVSRHVVFQPNMADLSPRGEEVVDTLAPVLRSLGNDLQINGHTNQAAGPPKYYATDWDLSAARALTVLRRLNEVLGIPGDRLSLAAFGHEQPLIPPDQPHSQEINKRVDIVVLPDVDQSAKELLGEIAQGKATEQQSEHGTEHTSTNTSTDTDTGGEGETSSGDGHDEASGTTSTEGEH
ncbi:flagellar motor protein MotB [Nocardioides mangrovi]|uniref:Flagellar motor protein MotB n=1 Tax=Nocardioides mangrovi TaxID=2874580 RepID=A0ABS7UA39_9ACTN|nr:flagellar motor protein MotB [Nocardioides mangrovi]MBZ5737821.1 flagellar motor protein MotB [Nocardioides mangrovi]